MLPVLPLLLLAGAGMSDPAAAAMDAAASPGEVAAERAAPSADGDRTWSLTVWPNAALIADKVIIDLDYDLLRSVTCIKGRPEITLRTYHYGPRPPGSRKGCDTQCRTERVANEADGRRPSGYSEQVVDWPQAMRLMAAEGWSPGKPLRRKTVRAEDLLVAEGEIDENIDGVPDEAAKPRKVQDLEGTMAELGPRFAAACRFKIPRPPAPPTRAASAPALER